MKLHARALCFLAIAWALFCLKRGAGFSQKARPARPNETSDSLLKSFLSGFDLPAAADEAGQLLHQSPNDALALFMRMETAELQERPPVVLDSALRLCVRRVVRNCRSWPQTGCCSMRVTPGHSIQCCAG